MIRPDLGATQIIEGNEDYQQDGYGGGDYGKYTGETLDEDGRLVKFDLDSASAVTYITDCSSLMRNPSTVNTIASSKLELQLNFLAKQLELERQRREKLQSEVQTMAKKLNQIQEEGTEELKKNETQRLIREANVKRPNMDVEDLKVLNNGFVSIS